MEQIINKIAYWGNHTFEATKDNIDGKDVIRIDVLKSFPSFNRKHEATYFVETKEQLLELSKNEKCSLRFFTGNLSHTQRKNIQVERKLKTGRIVEETKTLYFPAINFFIEAFRHDL